VSSCRYAPVSCCQFCRSGPMSIIGQYCFLLTQRGQYDLADEILRHILVSNAYQSRMRQDSIRLALISKPHRTAPITLSNVFSHFQHAPSQRSASPSLSSTRGSSSLHTNSTTRRCASSSPHSPAGSAPQTRSSLPPCRNICLGR